jgi:transaldolase/glucose-6-phosphate isomerase
MNPLLRLLEHGQSYWLDNLTRGMIRDGELERRVREEGLRGVTSNPAIFSKAISGGGEYDEQIEALAREGRSLQEIYEEVVVEDIRDACDVLRPVYDESDGRDGFVSLEVSPYLAHDTEGSIREARRLYRAVDRPNVLIKIPGTVAGVPAIEELLYEGINVNVTLLFSIEAYDAVARAHLRALERRLEEGSPVDDVASVASFFLSRIDVLVDRVLGHRIVPGRAPDGGPRPEELVGRVAVANALLAYRRFREIHSGERWERVAGAGAEPQRMLWASTSTKDPLYSDVRYVEPLIGPHTVNTLPERTIEAFADHGTVADTVEEGLEEARAVMEGLAEAGVDFDRITGQLLDEGVRKFVDPYDRLMATLAERRRALVGPRAAEADISAGPLEGDVDDALDSLRGRRFVRRLYARDASLWTDGADGTDAAAAIRGRLGWLDGGERFRDRLDEIVTFVASVREDGIEDVVMLGMGGSVGAARALAGALGSAPDHPVLTVLDDPHPEAVRAVDEATDPATTLYLVASKSGTTVETLSLYRFFLQRAREALGEKAAASRFAAVTDAGTPLADEAGRRGFRKAFLNPEDIGGRYSALSLFGLVPAALLGAGPGDLLEAADGARAACDPSLSPADHPGVRLGTVLGIAARRGRDKVTLFVSDRLAGVRPWLDQLLAESLGKDGRGLIPVAGETPVVPGAYRDDRLFVHVALEGEEDRGVDAAMEELARGGHPVIRLALPSPGALAGEFYRWMVATATAGFVLDVNPFDEPDVAAAKRETERLLATWREEGSFPSPEDDILADGDGLEVRGREG